MDVGVKLPYMADGSGEEFRSFVEACDGLGFASIWTGDHFVIPDHVERDNYPYLWRFSPDNDDLFPNKNFLEALTSVGFIVGASTRVQVGIGVLVVPMRHPVQLAAELATLDVLSSGRVIAGVGTGWLQEEFAAVDRPYESRGRALDEGIAVMRGLWSDAPFAYAGETVNFGPVHCLPRPPRQGGPPLWIGGDSRRALRRAATLGDGWQPVELPPETFADRSAELDELIVAAGREPSAVARSVSTRLPLSGRDDAQAVDLIGRYEEAGCNHLVVYSTPSRTIPENTERMARLSELLVEATN